jgi:hypothetical protein
MFVGVKAGAGAVVRRCSKPLKLGRMQLRAMYRTFKNWAGVAWRCSNQPLKAGTAPAAGAGDVPKHVKNWAGAVVEVL